MTTLIKDCTIINEYTKQKGSILIEDSYIVKIYSTEEQPPDADIIIDANNLICMPGIIDDQVHFREPGNEYKGDIESESAAAVLGGVTSYMEMPNTNPATTTLELLEDKFKRASETSYANYSFYLGATNNNIEEIVKADPHEICGLKIFMGSSTGDLLVDNSIALEEIFKRSPLLIATHCEDNDIIEANLKRIKEQAGSVISYDSHPVIRSREACIKSSSKAIELALKYNSSLHILHISTQDELDMLAVAKRANPLISGEVCVHYMIFDDTDYSLMESKIKCNPAIKSKTDKEAIIDAVKSGLITIVATDHAPHTIEEKDKEYLLAPSGLPLIQHSFQIMWELSLKGYLTLEQIADGMSHSPAKRFKIQERGYLKEGYKADLFLFNPSTHITVAKDNIHYKCKWSPLEGETLHSSIVHTLVNGAHIVNNGVLTGLRKSERLLFNNEKQI